MTEVCLRLPTIPTRKDLKTYLLTKIYQRKLIALKIVLNILRTPLIHPEPSMNYIYLKLNNFDKESGLNLSIQFFTQDGKHACDR